eukprot:m.287181 g.287181  ORF g.287181 m.287181 type:complete len:233 (+) comp19945_c0_seq8:143-841(+)
MAAIEILKCGPDTNVSELEEFLGRVEKLFREKLNGKYATVKETKHGVTFSRLDDDSIRGNTKCDCVRLQARIPCTPTECKELLLNYDERKKWDDGLVDRSRSDVHLWHEQGINVVHTLSAGAAGGIIKAREFLDMGKTVEESDGGWTHWASSVSFATVPTQRGLVRGSNFPCGLTFRPASDGTECDVTYVIHSNIGGWVPTRLVNSTIAGVLPGLIDKLIEHVRVEKGLTKQ